VPFAAARIVGIHCFLVVFGLSRTCFEFDSQGSLKQPFLNVFAATNWKSRPKTVIAVLGVTS
jgi:hypothetical protein